MDPKEIRKQINIEGARLIIQASVENGDTLDEMFEKANEAGVTEELKAMSTVTFLCAANKDSDMITRKGHALRRGNIRTLPKRGSKLRVIVDALHSKRSLTNKSIREALEAAGHSADHISTALNTLKSRNIADTDGYGLWKLTTEARTILEIEMSPT